MDREYRDASLIGAASLLAISAVYFANLKLPEGFLLLAIPASFGLTSYLSTDEFKRASLASLIALPFALIGIKMLVSAVTISLGNVLISVFSDGERLRDYYRSTKLPLIVVGIVVGLGAFAMIQIDSQMQEDLRSTTSEEFATQANSIVQDMGLVESRRQEQLNLVKTISSRSVDGTANYVMQDVKDNLTREGLLAVTGSFNQARTEVPETIANETNRNLQQQQVNITSSMEQLFRQQFTAERMIVVVPIVILAALSIQPVVGLVATLVASVAARIEPER